ncbi:hypothetical protein EG240_04575 [Paenimyroides tangerinum]|uniref:Uncharacterized protein n=1 Tax=Paenimyroides tangerinum TaxID=2488728 RepID=A0A3P3WBS7_9FLAO|nr:hypothetical protein [Paenimyroides tangerinum]RRJ91838.1 hypothetical protein EG240_04575 [Paenimyroides tangerinum]
MDTKVGEFNSVYNSLTVTKETTFEIGIKEYIDAINNNQLEIKAIEKNIKDLDLALRIEKDYLSRQSQERYKEGGKWIKAETYEGKSISFAEVSYKENLKIAEKKFNKKVKKENDKLKELKIEKDNIETYFSTVVWGYELSDKSSLKSVARNKKISIGTKPLKRSLSNQALGGGFIKVEPFFEEASPTNNPKNTLYIHSKPEDPKIIAAEWYGFDENKNIKKNRKYGFHIKQSRIAYLHL